MKALSRRIVSVSNTQQIMKAMNLVAASKVQKYKSKMEAVRPFFGQAQNFLADGIHMEDVNDHIFFTPRKTGRAVYVVMCGERGLCGSYNANILKTAFADMERDTSRNIEVIAVGAKCREYFVRRNKKVIENYDGVLENPTYSVASAIAQSLATMYTTDNESERIDEIYVAYTQFETLLSHNPSVIPLLPFEPKPAKEEVIYEPNIDTYLRKAVPEYLAMYIFGAMVDAGVCEQASRMTSMDAAASNAGDIVDDLKLQYNRQRQGVITQEISEIVSGANAI